MSIEVPYELKSVPVFDLQVERLEVGALVSIRGIGRIKIIKFVQVSNKRTGLEYDIRS